MPQRIQKVARAVPGIALGGHTVAMLHEYVASNHFRRAQDDGMSHCASERCTQRDDRSDIFWPLSRNRTRDDPAQAVADQMNPTSRFGEGFLDGFIQLLPDQEIRTLGVEADSRKEGLVSDSCQPLM